MDIKYIIINIIGTLLRFSPFPYKAGLIKIGHPDRDSPVFMTCNYILTVERVKKALEGLDCYLLVANSGGINVWCASAGGYLNNHSVISGLKTSGIEDLVNHRNIILPQLAASGVEGSVIREKTGWNVIWGPVYARDIRRFIENRLKKIPDMREVKFDLKQRIETSIMWAFPFSLITYSIVFFIWREIALSIFTLIWILSFLTFLPFPFYSKWIEFKRNRLRISKYTIIFDLSSNILVLWGIFLVLLISYQILTNNLNIMFIIRWGSISFIITLFLSIDLMGSTPIYKSGLHEERFFEVSIDIGRCDGCGICREVCPKNCYDIDTKSHRAVLARLDGCVKCGACIIQCPRDALCFSDKEGNIILPETIRKFKLNLMGKRIVKVPS